MDELEIINSSFFDFGERGKLGFLNIIKDGENITIKSFLNNYEIENYFLKAIAFQEKRSY